MSIEELKKQFIVDDDALKTRLEPLVAKALNHCRISKSGEVIITNQNLSARDQVMLILSARAIASQLDSAISADVAVADLAKSTGLPTDQIRARARDIIGLKLAVSPKRGDYRAIPHKIEAFLDSLAQSRKAAKA